MTRPRRLITRGRLIAILAVGVLAVSVTAIVNYAISSPPVAPPVEQPLPPAGGNEQFTETDLAHVQNVFGPFRTIAVSPNSPTPDTQAPAVLLLMQNGSTQASQAWTVPFASARWQQGDIVHIASISLARGYATFGTNLNRTFVVKCNQPFIFEENPQQVSVVDVQGNTWSITTARAEASRQAK